MEINQEYWKIPYKKSVALRCLACLSFKVGGSEIFDHFAEFEESGRIGDRRMLHDQLACDTSHQVGARLRPAAGTSAGGDGVLRRRTAVGGEPDGAGPAFLPPGLRVDPWSGRRYHQAVGGGGADRDRDCLLPGLEALSGPERPGASAGTDRLSPSSGHRRCHHHHRRCGIGIRSRPAAGIVWAGAAGAWRRDRGNGTQAVRGRAQCGRGGRGQGHRRNRPHGGCGQPEAAPPVPSARPDRIGTCPGCRGRGAGGGRPSSRRAGAACAARPALRPAGESAGDPSARQRRAARELCFRCRRGGSAARGVPGPDERAEQRADLWPAGLPARPRHRRRQPAERTGARPGGGKAGRQDVERGRGVRSAGGGEPLRFTRGRLPAGGAVWHRRHVVRAARPADQQALLLHGDLPLAGGDGRRRAAAAVRHGAGAVLRAARTPDGRGGAAGEQRCAQRLAPGAAGQGGGADRQQGGAARA